MSREPAKPLTFVICSVLEAEVRLLVSLKWPQAEIVALDSILHIHPQELADSLERAVSKELAEGRRVVLVYGDCFARMDELEKRRGVVRVAGINCTASVLGKEHYRRLVREGAFFLLPEWTERWHMVFSEELGLSPENAQSLMCEMHRKLVYLDTGVVPVPLITLQACSEYCGLPYEILPVKLDPLRGCIEDAINRLSLETTTV